LFIIKTYEFGHTLIFPPISVNERYNINAGNVGGNLPPLGLAYIAACLEKAGYSVEIIAAPALEFDIDDIIKVISDKNPKAIGFTSLTPTFHRVAIASDKIKEKFPDKIIILGGHHATIMQEKILEQNKSIDIVVYGEGEITAVELMDAISSNKTSSENLSKIDGIIFRDENGNIIKTKPRELIENLDEFRFQQDTFFQWISTNHCQTNTKDCLLFTWS